jgi:hypothetical protein
MALQGVGAATSAIGAYGSAKSQKSALGFQAQMADMNAELAERRAQISLEQGAYQAQEIERGGARQKGAQRAAMGASGIALGSTTAQAIVVGTDLVTAEDAQQARINAVRAAWGQRTEATNMRNEGRAARANARGINPMGAAATSLLGSATSMTRSAYDMGMFKGSGVTSSGGAQPSSGSGFRGGRDRPMSRFGGYGG